MTRRPPRDVVITQTATRRRQCPVCQTWHDAATGMHLDDAPTTAHPQLGCVTICGACAAVLVFVDTESGLRVAEESDIVRLDPDAQRLVREIVRARAFGPRRH